MRNEIEKYGTLLYTVQCTVYISYFLSEFGLFSIVDFSNGTIEVKRNKSRTRRTP